MIINDIHLGGEDYVIEPNGDVTRIDPDSTGHPVTGDRAAAVIAAACDADQRRRAS